MVNLRLAQPADQAALLDLFASVPMTGNLALVTRRDPDFFALYAIQRGTYECWLYEDDTQLLGMGTVLVRDGWLAGQPCKVGYLGDLRERLAGSRRRGLARFYGEIFEEARQRHGCEIFLTAVLASNTLALNSLVRRRPERLGQPYYHLLRRFAAVAIHLTWHWPASRQNNWEVGHASAADLPALGAFLDHTQRALPGGYRFDSGELEHRLACWPGFTLEQTFLAYDRRGRLAGCATVWDPAAVKRYQVQAYRGSMRWIKSVWNAIAVCSQAPRLPEPGDSFRMLYLCQVSIRHDDPAILRALLEHIYTVFRPQGYHFLMLCLYENDPLATALRGFLQHRLGFHLYAVSSSQAPRTGYPAGRPGFEMVLA